MGVYIKGMEMPKAGMRTIDINADGTVYVYGAYPTELYKAIPIPTHGRLIDADELYEHAKLRSEQFDGYFNVMDNVINALYIKTFPTIIPGDPTDKDGEE